MPALSEYTNVYDTALEILSRKGFQLWYDPTSELYGAEKDGWDFLAESPCSLLGLITIYEYQAPSSYREYWWRQDSGTQHTDLPTSPRGYRSVIEREGNSP